MHAILTFITNYQIFKMTTRYFLCSNMLTQFTKFYNKIFQFLNTPTVNQLSILKLILKFPAPSISVQIIKIMELQTSKPTDFSNFLKQLLNPSTFPIKNDDEMMNWIRGFNIQIPTLAFCCCFNSSFL